jgi:hypothetical protein
MLTGGTYYEWRSSSRLELDFGDMRDSFICGRRKAHRQGFSIADVEYWVGA